MTGLGIALRMCHFRGKNAYVQAHRDHFQANIDSYLASARPQVEKHLESVKTASDIYAPVSGEVVEVNTALEDAPETLNTAPYEDGWMFKLRVTDESELEKLLGPDAYRELAESRELASAWTEHPQTQPFSARPPRVLSGWKDRKRVGFVA